MNELEKYFPNLSQEQIQKFNKLIPLYNYWNQKVNLVSRKDIDNLFINHILHSLSIANVITFKSSTQILDVGTGGGFPGIPLAIFFSDCHFTLVDSIGKKIDVVKSICDELSLSNINAINDRVENHYDKYDFVLSRAVARMDKFYELVKKNISPRSSNEKLNGIISLKGGDLSHELKDFKENKVFNISEYLPYEYFQTKKVVYIPFNP